MRNLTHTCHAHDKISLLCLVNNTIVHFLNLAKAAIYYIMCPLKYFSRIVLLSLLAIQSVVDWASGKLVLNFMKRNC